MLSVSDNKYYVKYAGNLVSGGQNPAAKAGLPHEALSARLEAVSFHEA